MKCLVCKQGQASIALKVCADCIKKKWDKTEIFVKEAHKKSREKFGLPSAIPKKGLLCGLCANNCKIPVGEKGYCGLTANINGKLVRLAGTPEKGLLHYYYDSLPTNCVSIWHCPNRKIAGCNLAVFYGACCFDCLFCQNWEFRYMTKKLGPLISAEKLANAITNETKCVCFFGGDPAPQMPHAIATAKIARKNTNRILRWCLESNGMENPALLKEFAKIASESGGIIKFDLKAWNEKLAIALSGVSNKAAYKNFEMLADIDARLLSVSTLLVPFYVEAEEVRKIAKFIASINKNIPYSLLAFYPCFEMTDLPCTTRKHAYECMKVARNAGLKKVRIGNIHLLR